MNLGFPQPSGAKHWLLSFTPAIGHSPLHSLTRLLMKPSLEQSLICLCLEFGAVLLMCSSRGTSDHLGALEHTWRSVSSLDNLRATRDGSSTTLLPKRLLFLKGLTLMSATSCFRDTQLPTSLPLVLGHSLRRLQPPPHCLTSIRKLWTFQT